MYCSPYIYVLAANIRVSKLYKDMLPNAAYKKELYVAYVNEWSLFKTTNSIGKAYVYTYMVPSLFNASNVAYIVRDTHGGGWSRNINARYLHTLMVYL